ncbi:unnamed protein product, partial [Didymodactylos carnosus]
MDERLDSACSLTSKINVMDLEQHLHEQMNEPVPEDWYKHYFDTDNNRQTYSFSEFCDIFQITPILGKRLLKQFITNFNFDDKCNRIDSKDIWRIARVLWEGSACLKSLILFRVFDENDDKLITVNDIKNFYDEYLNEDESMILNNKDHETILDTIVDGYSWDANKEMTFDRFHDTLVRQTNGKIEDLFKIYFTNDTRTTDNKKSKQKRLELYIKNHLKEIIFLLSYILTQIGLLLWVVFCRYTVIYEVHKEDMHPLIVIAKICAMLLSFNCSLIIVLMLKQIITLIRCSYLRYILPVDCHIDFHRIVGRYILVLAVIHAISHMVHFSILKTPYTWAELMFTFAANQGTIIPGFATISGIILSFILITIIIFSFEYIRRSGHFELFYFTHLLYIPFFIFLIMHGNGFWKWIIGPLTIFVIEKVYELCQFCRSSHGKTHMKFMTIFESYSKSGKLESSVLALSIKRPRNFDYRPGDYLFLNIPAISKFEWHPYTISSGPEEKDTLSVHIHAVGNWTNKVLEYSKLVMHKNDSNGLCQIVSHLNITTEPVNVEPLKRQSFLINDSVLIDGPYSSCARYIFDVEHAVLIGGGIGVTPYASILTSLMVQFRLQRIKCKQCNHINYTTPISGTICTDRILKKVDFVWINRDIQAFEWFLDLLAHFEQEQEDYLKDVQNDGSNERQRFLDLHLFFTGNTQRKD